MPVFPLFDSSNLSDLSFIKKIANWEQWPFKVLYAPMAPVWIYYMIKSRSFWFFSSSNPKLTFGGMEGEPKKEMHDLLPAKYRAAYFNVLPDVSFDSVKEMISQHNLNFPVIVKPEVGSQGILMRKINTEEQLKYYHDHVSVEYIIQQYVSYPMEVSLFYYRYPWEKKGNITGFLHKVPMSVQGDGIHTLKELILKNPKAVKRIDELSRKHKSHLDVILDKGVVYKLSDAGNHNRGASFIDLKAEIDDSLRELLDEISLSINDFFYGRYDILCNSVAELKERKNFIILEYNGCGAEPNHFYDTGYTLKNAYLEIMKHWKKLYTISKYNHLHGCEYWDFNKGLQFCIKTNRHFKQMKTADKIIP